MAVFTGIIVLAGFLLSSLGVTQGDEVFVNCEDFPTQIEAQQVFMESGGPEIDPYELDADGDGVVCEWGVESFRPSPSDDAVLASPFLNAPNLYCPNYIGLLEKHFGNRPDLTVQRTGGNEEHWSNLYDLVSGLPDCAYYVSHAQSEGWRCLDWPDYEGPIVNDESMQRAWVGGYAYENGLLDYVSYLYEVECLFLNTSPPGSDEPIYQRYWPYGAFAIVGGLAGLWYYRRRVGGSDAEVPRES